MHDQVGEYGVTQAELEAIARKAAPIHDDLMARRESGELKFYDLPFDQKMLNDVEAVASTIRDRFSNLVVLGIGGSALGSRAVLTALGEWEYNLRPQSKRETPRLFICDNVDPLSFSSLLNRIDPKDTLFFVISKSGSTVETMTQFLIARDWLEKGLDGKKGQDFKEHLLFITDPKSGTLRRLADEEGYRAFPVPPEVGGRFSIFTPVGLLPLASIGIDIRGLLAGAAALEPAVTNSDLFANPAYLNAALQFASYQKGLSVSVMMPYVDSLSHFADWYIQLWAESLGKKSTLDGETVFHGMTPIKAVGATDQHSQVQLYMEGPFDKTVTFLVVDSYGADFTIPGDAAIPELSYLAGKSMSELIHAEQQATAVALVKNGRPNCSINIDSISAESLGALIYLFEVQTLFAGGLLSINPLDQPGVEEGKQFMYGIMGRVGFEEKKDEFQKYIQCKSDALLTVDLDLGCVG